MDNKLSPTNRRDKNLNNVHTDLIPGPRTNSRESLAKIFERLKVESQSQSKNGDKNRILLNRSTASDTQLDHYYNNDAPGTKPLNIMDEKNVQGLSNQEQSPLICSNSDPNEAAYNFYDEAGSDNGVNVIKSSYGAIGSNKCSNENLPHWGHGEEAGHDDHSSPINYSEKWSCTSCTYDNWPKAMKCVMCFTPRGKSVSSPEHQVQADLIPYSPSEVAPSNEVSVSTNNRIRTAGSNSLMSIGSNSIVVPNNRRTRELDRRWLEACNGVVDGNSIPVESYLAAGGDPTRQLTQTEVAILDRPSAFDVGFTLVHLACRFQHDNILASLLSQVGGGPTVAKRVPSYAAPDLANEVQRHVKSMIRQRKGNFRCQVASEFASFTLPSEIEEYPTDLQETVFDEVLDRDVQKELDDGQFINWSTEILEQLNSRLYALWNRSAGDCLLDSVLQATWGVFDQDNVLRHALSDTLQECSTIFYQRWKENELLSARLLHFSIPESQFASDWTNLLSLASKPGSSLEQLHIFVLAHILRRPILIYGVKFVKSFRGENLGYARYEGLYLPFFWEIGFCNKSPICLGYTRGHFSALVTIEPDCDPMSTATSAAQLVPPDLTSRCAYLPLTSVDGNLIPIHFMSQNDIGKEEMIMSQWLDVRYTDTGLMVACQEIQTPPLVVKQMVEEWLIHYRRLGQLTTRASYLSQPVPPCYSSDESDD